ncbi:DUF1822 family protein [Coleofasciculus sp. FACHB-1120]|uniref:DUF1822 family protein n=1 Tax=Coleofasciculus sp. FACHB-1120 TaxID=2692783 RepID=UPI001689A2FE|nr:DUF1822 family protein [Coleofasciculus sp. FACHB-1120]MBD2741859.1 DUF1822 family protein [Coleofasciculus sp. FACHB-1120]
MNYLTDLTDDWVELEELPETIPLESEQLDQAVELSNQVGNEDRKWQTYLQALILLSFEEWLRKREPEIFLDREHSSVFQPQYTNAIDAVFNLRVSKFKVCLIPTITLTDKEVTIPRAVVDLPEFTAHFYIVIGIEEDLEIAAIRGFLRYDQLINYQPQLQPEADWTYQIPIAWFNREPNELLLYLQCLALSAIPLPEIPTNRQDTLARMQSTLLTLLPQLRNRPLWQVLTWEQGAAVLTTPDLLNWLYQPLTENTATVTNHLSELLQILTQQAINVRNWLRNQVDEVMQELSWEALPAPSPLRGTEPIRELPASFSLRRSEQNPSQELDEILIEISRNNQLEIPANSGRAYRDLTLGTRLRLYAVTWSFPDDDGWTLLLILKAIYGNESQEEMTLRVSDRVEVLAEDTLQLDGNEDYIFTQVAGTYQDKFLATITSETGKFQTLPPFEFIL